MSDFLAMSDEDFLKQQSPEEGAAAAEGETQTTEAQQPLVTEQDATEQSTEADLIANPSPGTTEAQSAEGEEQGEPDPPGSTTAATATTTTEQDPSSQQEGKDAKSGEPKEDASQAANQDASAAPDYAAFYKQIMAPFRANGKMVELRTPEEAIQLMQMGANYTRKMQDLQPHRKVLLMLENNGLLDEGKLSFLIDIEKKNPEAIKKLIKEAGVDPLEIDTTAEPAYREGSHRVSDEEANFRTALDDMKSSQPGMETLQLINTDWDQASKEVLWKSPEVMTIIHQQRESGIYGRIAAEVNRQRTLGKISPEVPFLQAYKAVGDQLVAANAFADLTHIPASPAPLAQPAVVATRIAAPKPAVVNGDKVSAATTTRTTSQKSKEFINPLAMSDDEFLKQMQNRL